MSITSSIPLFRTSQQFGSSSSAEGSASCISSSDDSISPMEHMLAVSEPKISSITAKLLMKIQSNFATPLRSTSVIKHSSYKQADCQNFQTNEYLRNLNRIPYHHQNPRQIEELLKLTNSLFSKQIPFLQKTKDEESQLELVESKSEENDCDTFFATPSRPCQICRIEAARVSHFGVPVCTGCRAFFRRSVSQQKTYTCLKSRLCGGNKLVPNRRVCKFCRFQRCVTAGMLKGKEQLQMQNLEESLMLNKRSNALPSLDPSSNLIEGDGLQVQIVHVSPYTLSPREYFVSVDLTKNVIEQFLVTRRKIIYERMQLYYNKPIQLEELRKNTANFLQESNLLKLNFIAITAPFNEFGADDQISIFAEYSICWMTFEMIYVTTRKGGHYKNRNYYIDGRYIQLNEENAMHQWGSVFQDLFQNHYSAGLLKQSLVNYFLATGIFYKDCASELAKAHISDEEASALFLLLCTRQEVLGMVSKKSSEELRKLREKVLRNLGTHLESTGQDVAKRMDQIISLINPIQEAVSLWKRCTKLLNTAICLANVGHERLCPEYPEYVNLIEKVEKYVKGLQISADDKPE